MSHRTALEQIAALAGYQCGHTAANKAISIAREAIEAGDTDVRIKELEAERDNLKLEVTRACLNNHRRNLELDALHYVWCDGGCRTGTHRFEHREPLTEEIVQSAVSNTRRLVAWWENRQSRNRTAAVEAARNGAQS